MKQERHTLERERVAERSLSKRFVFSAVSNAFLENVMFHFDIDVSPDTTT